MKAITISIVFFLALSGLYQVPAAYCFQNTAKSDFCPVSEHKNCHHKSCRLDMGGMNRRGAAHNHSVRHKSGNSSHCETRIECSHPDGSHLYPAHGFEIYLPAKVELSAYYQTFSKNSEKKITYDKIISFPFERPPALTGNL